MRGLAILLTFQLIGTLIHTLLHVPLPGPVLGMILFSLSLFLGWVKLQWVEETAALLLRHMLLFFAPVIVGSLEFFPQLRTHWLVISVSLGASTLLVMSVTGWIATGLIPISSEAPMPPPAREKTLERLP